MNHLVNTVLRFLKVNSPTILTIAAVGGTVATAYLSGKASYKAAFKIQSASEDGTIKLEKKDVVLTVWHDYIPAAVAGTATIACIVGSNKVSSQRLVAATVAYSVADRAFSEYKEKVVEQLGFRKEETIRDEIAQAKVLKNPPPETFIGGVEGLRVMCHEAYTGRYFVCDMETLRRSQNDVNADLIKSDFATLNDFYDLVGLDRTSVSGEIGWSSSKLMELIFSTVLSPGGIPCVSFAYNYASPLNGKNYGGFCMAE